MNIAGIYIAEPRWLWLAAVAPVLLALLQRRAAKARHTQLASLASPSSVARLTASHSPARRQLKNVLLLLAFVFAGLALARPQWGSLENGNSYVGEDVVFVLDCSLSMTTSDVAPSRLQRAKFALLDFVQKQGDGRVGLVTFAGSAFLSCPLTFDKDGFEGTLMGIDEKAMPVPGTDIGRALNEAGRAMDKNARRKLVVLLTDGEDLEKNGIVAAKRLATNGVVVFTIGVGTPAGKEVQTLNAAGQAELLHDAQGGVVRSRLDEPTLQEIARVTGGSYFPLGRLGDGLMQVRSAMHQLDTNGSTSAATKRGVDRFYIPLAIMVLLLVVEPLISTRRSKFSATTT